MPRSLLLPGLLPGAYHWLLPPALLACAHQDAQTAPGPSEPPSVVVIVLDDVGRDDVHPAVPFTPAIERFAREGVCFTRAYSWPVCSPTRYAALFGRLPRRDGIGDVIDSLRPELSPSPQAPRELVSLAEALRPTHRTALFGKWHLGRAGLAGQMDQPASGPFVQGFDRWLSGMPNGASRGPLGETHYAWNRVEDGELYVSGEYATDAQASAFVDWWTSTSGPRFAWLAFAAAHPPFDPPPGLAPLGSPRADYEQMIAHLDQALDSVLDVIDLDDTYVVICGDNGTPDDARAAGAPAGHFKGTVFEGGIRVPLLISGPVSFPGAVSDRLVSLVDLPATVLELVGSARPRAAFGDSLSFADALRSQIPGAAPRRFVFAERYTATQDELAIVEERWKLRRFDPDGPAGPQGYRDEVYDLLVDPDETEPFESGAGVEVVHARLAATLGSLPARAD